MEEKVSEVRGEVLPYVQNRLEDIELVVNEGGEVLLCESHESEVEIEGEGR